MTTATLPSNEFATDRGPWAMLEHSFHSHRQLSQRVTVHMALPDASVAVDNAGPALMIRDGLAIIGISGPMLKQAHPFWSSSSTVLARRKMIWETPGGTVAGTNELANDIAEAAKVKPVWSFAEGSVLLGWLLVRMSGGEGFCKSAKAAENAGVKVHVVKAGEFKGAGTPGTVVSDKFLAELQREVNTLKETFVAAVAAGRKLPLERARALADGRTYLAAAAVRAGLIDGVQSLDLTFAQFVEHVKKPAPSAGSSARAVEQTTAAPPPALSHEAATDPTVFPSPCQKGMSAMSQDPIAAWNAAVTAEQEAAARIGRPISKSEATAKVARAQPQLREAYVQAYNEQTPERRARR